MTGWARWRELLQKTLAGEAQGFFIPYRHAGGNETPADNAYPAIMEMFEVRRGAFGDILNDLETVQDDLLAIGPDSPPEPRWNQTWFPVLDAAIAYGMVRWYQPRRIVEIGSGHSTRFLARAMRDGGMTSNLTAIDPAPRAVIEGLPIRFIRSTVQDVGEAAFENIRSGDMISMDSSHILMPGTDVDMMLNRVYPALPEGVLLHTHDIFLPDGYPADWTWRGYNEQNGIAAMITSGAYEILWASHFAATRMTGELVGSTVAALPAMEDDQPSSLWLRKL